MIKKIVIISSAVILVAAVVFFAVDGSASKSNGLKTVKVEKGSIIEKALAVGKIEPQKEISVKSKISGLVKKIYVEIGDRVNAGDRLIDIAPDPTPIEFAEAKRQVEIYQVSYNNAKQEFDRVQLLKEKKLISDQDFEQKKATFDEATLRLKLADERLALIQSGKTEIADLKVDNTIRSTVTGTVLARLVEEGDPIVPLTSYQAGTDLMTLAYMEDLVFRGTVDEIDVGKLRIDLPVEIKIGAIPNDTIRGYLYKISPKARQQEGSTLFDIEIRLTQVGSSYLRAGYSSNANIIINQKENILLVPERLVKITDSSSTVEVQDSLGVISTVNITTGLSDGINIEVVDGIKEGDLLVERPPKTIE
jgi:HlyD family secretion protein